MEAKKTKVWNHKKYPYGEMFIMRKRVKEYINGHGFDMNNLVPDILNSIAIKILDDAILRAYLSRKRVTVMPTDMSLLTL